MTAPIRLGTRGSALATTQSRLVADAITRVSGRPVELVIITTLGDVATGPLAAMPQPGVFVSALRTALVEQQVDVVVHSMKDLPSEPVDGIALAAVPVRVDPRDALVSKGRTGIAGLPMGARVGTSSPRRSARLAVVRPDLILEDLRGNVDSRLEKVRTGPLDATVLAVAGLTRLGRQDEIDEIIAFDVMLPAPAQGALAVEARADHLDLLRLLAVLDDEESRITTTAERAVLSAVNATCASAVGAHAVLDGGLITLTADVSGREPGQYVTVQRSAPVSTVDDARLLGAAVGGALLEAGAGPFVSPAHA